MLINVNQIEDNSINSAWSWKEKTTQRGNLHCYLYKHCTDRWLTQIRTVNLCLWSSMGNSFQMSLWNLQNERHRGRRILHVTKKYHHHKHRPHSNFQHLLQNTRCKMLLNRMIIALQATKGINPTLTSTLLIMTVTVMTVTLNCIRDYTKQEALNSLHDTDYYK